MIGVHAIAIGQIEKLDYHPTKEMESALNKGAITEATWLSRTGFTNDEQAFPGHGGPEKAVCCFSKANYAMWADEVPALPDYAMFGENVTIIDLDENDVALGDQFRLGDAIIEVSEIREPCWKIQAKYGVENLAMRMAKSGKTGFYCRVAQEGYVYPDSQLEVVRIAEAKTRLTIQTLNDIFYNDRKNIPRIEAALLNPYLTEARIEILNGMKKRAQK